MTGPTAALLVVLALGCCLYAARKASEEMAWVRALDAALSSARGDGALVRSCGYADPELRGRALQHPAREGEVLISEHDGAPALFVGEARDMVCLDCVRRRL